MSKEGYPSGKDYFALGISKELLIIRSAPRQGAHWGAGFIVMFVACCCSASGDYALGFGCTTSHALLAASPRCALRRGRPSHPSKAFARSLPPLSRLTNVVYFAPLHFAILTRLSLKKAISLRNQLCAPAACFRFLFGQQITSASQIQRFDVLVSNFDQHHTFFD